ncbi:MAG: hypothetical protein M1834_003578 [Cirrosporium novae-zelandiae]|nr:MAG: hypothetical protein M1834_003578 [Cirrosporium novae-zelandiae]
MATAPTPTDRLHYISSQQHFLEEQIQSLLDAQSDGLLAGLGRPPSPSPSPSLPASTTTANTTASLIPPPITASTYALAPIPTPSPKRKQKHVSLNTARTSLLSSLHHLSSLSTARLQALASLLSSRNTALNMLDSLTSQRETLQSSISAISSSPASTRAHGLGQQVQNIDNEIRELEEQLAMLKVKRRRLAHEKEKEESKAQAEISSYRASLSLLENKITKFLAHPPVTRLEPNIVTTGIPLKSDQNENDTQGFYVLIAKRRTLEMARTTFTDEKQTLESAIKATETERTALQEGTELWASCIKDIKNFEKKLRQEIRKLTAHPLSNSNPGSMPVDEEDAETKLKNLLTEMDAVLKTLEDRHNKAVSNGWKLLDVAIGAEVEAFREGKELLEELISTPYASASTHQPPKVENSIETEEENAGIAAWDAALEDGQLKLKSDGADDGGSFNTEAEGGLAGRDQQATPTEGTETDTEDDEPGPAFLVTHIED